jgi:hypothetical protein
MKLSRTFLPEELLCFCLVPPACFQVQFLPLGPRGESMAKLLLM